MTLASQIASDLLDIKAVYLKPEEPFTWASGIKSSATTNSIAPAANDNNHGCKNVKYLAKKNPIIAATGSTAPLPIPNKNDLFLLCIISSNGKETAAPSGKFCIAIPIAKPKALI